MGERRAEDVVCKGHEDAAGDESAYLRKMRSGKLPIALRNHFRAQRVRIREAELGVRQGVVHLGPTSCEHRELGEHLVAFEPGCVGAVLGLENRLDDVLRDSRAIERAVPFMPSAEVLTDELTVNTRSISSDLSSFLRSGAFSFRATLASRHATASG